MWSGVGAAASGDRAAEDGLPGWSSEPKICSDNWELPMVTWVLADRVLRLPRVLSVDAWPHGRHGTSSAKLPAGLWTPQ